MFMHNGGTGDEQQLTAAIGKIVAEPAPVTIDPAKSAFDPAKIESALGRKGDLVWAAFAGSDDEAVVDSDCSMYEREVQGVLKALRRSGIRIVAIHNHMIGESQPQRQ